MRKQLPRGARGDGMPCEGLRERKKREVRRHVREVALALFVKHGYEAVSVEQIATAAGVSRTTVFNYYSSKEAVITDPDPGMLAHQRMLCSKRPDDEPLWDSLTSVMLDGLLDGRTVITAHKRLGETSPALMNIRRHGIRPMVDNLREWAENRLDPTRKQEAVFQLNVMGAAISAAFDQWNPDEPYDTFVQLASAHIYQLRRSFEPQSTQGG